jgi:hypothetical protein
MVNNKKNIKQNVAKDKNMNRIDDGIISNRIIYSEKHNIDTIPYTNYIDFGFGYGRKYLIRHNKEIDY